MTQPAHRVWANVRLNAVRHNLSEIRKRLAGAKLMSVLKANAYGHGSVRMAQLMQSEGIDAIGVGDSQEALELRNANITLPILIVGAVIPGEMTHVVSNDIQVNLHNEDMAEALNQAAKAEGKVAEVHLKIDTGMGRLGMPPFSAVPFLHRLHHLKHLRLVGMCTHFSYPFEENPAFTDRQIEQFLLAVEVAERLGYDNLTLHTSASLALFKRDDARFNMARVGIAQWGQLPGATDDLAGVLRPALSLHSKILFLKDVPEGTPIGYNRTWYAAAPTRIATVPIGYNDGYRVSLSNNADVLVRGRRCPVVGRVSMDYLTVDVGHVEGVSVGDTVTLLGRSDAETLGSPAASTESITLHELATRAGSMEYEFLCGLGRRVTRVYV